MAERKHDDDTKPRISIPTRMYGFPPAAFDYTRLPDFDTNFLPPEHLEAFIQALSAPDPVQSPSERHASLLTPGSPAFSRQGSTTSASFFDNLLSRQRRDVTPSQDERETSAAAADVAAPRPPTRSNSNNNSLFITAQSDWAPVHEKVVRDRGDRDRRRTYRKSSKRRPRVPLPLGLGGLVGGRSKDETREGYLYSLLKWPFLLIVGTWILGLSVAYLATRFYVFLYEQGVAWRGKREKLRRAMRATSSYRDWVIAAKRMDEYFGNEKWKEENEFAYYDSKTVRRVGEQMRKCRERAEAIERELSGQGKWSDEEVVAEEKKKAVEDLKALVEACVKNNFVGIENPRLYSQTYYGTKNLVQNFVDEVERSLNFLVNTKQLAKEEKRTMFKGICANYGRTALCLSGGATFAYYHFGVVKALLEADLLPDIITGTSGGALVAGLVATRTNEELKQLLVPALAHKITACREPITVWFRRWWSTGARFDSVDWAKQCAWWCHGSMTFREAYERTGRILNVSCVPADPHSPTILCNYLTSPDCVIWSAVLASAAVPGILNPVVLMMKTRAGQLVPYSFGHKWKDGSLRTDIPIKALNLHFNVNFTIVSQVNPHINLFFFSSRGSVGQPVTHRKGRGWRGGYLGSATEQYIKLDLTKWLRVLRQLELLPRPLGQDWSQLWLQQFGGNITIWPKSILSDFIHILSDPDAPRLARMIHEGQQSAFPKLKFIANRLKVERQAERGRRETRTTQSGSSSERRGSIESILSEDDLRDLLRKVERKTRGGGDRRFGGGGSTTGTGTGTEDETTDFEVDEERMLDGGGPLLDGEGIGDVLLDGARDEMEEGKVATPAGLAVTG
ncbi:patatin-like phospholipase [Echria macrotheca]|uniref:Patatin-like phospholipase domain-containing protein n=1 Tax=Echria macrotheca TaxID=438768 RepID=A0AAJ0F808_9PEZI|nr:patatin-like phospholipase [Echria macrotheca]